MAFNPNSLWGNQSSTSSLAAYQQLLQQQTMYGTGMASLANPMGLPGVSAVSGIDKKLIDKLKKTEPREVLRRTPDGFIPAVAWRGWALKSVDGEWRLSAVGVNAIWEPKKMISATCNGGSGNHPAPHMDCSCGIWSFETLDKLIPAVEGYGVKVIGQVSIWGRIIECENGYRSQFAYPKELWLLDSSLEQLGYIYGVPVRMIEK